ncbi:hypothetical protein D7X94_17175 [Acutalibacter sp. 1XD8-33]|nr:hypothetical protein D7X94_17175 [Acutalibacter sp. 1XD8-33]
MVLAVYLVMGMMPLGVSAATADSDFTIENGALKKYNDSGTTIFVQNLPGFELRRFPKSRQFNSTAKVWV